MRKIIRILLLPVISCCCLLGPSQVKAESATVTSNMTNDEILKIIKENDEVSFSAGTYKGLSIEFDGVEPIFKNFIANGEVIFQSETSKDAGIVVKGNNMVNLNFNGLFKLQNYQDNIFVNNNAKLTINIKDNATLSLTNAKETEQNHGNGLWAGYNTTLNINGYNNSNFIASNNAMTGINVLGGSTAILKFNKSNLIDLSNNAKSSGYHAGMDGKVNTEITFDSINKVTLNNNGWDAINFQTGDYSRLNIINSKNVELKGNSGWGTNGGDLYFLSSNIDASDNATFTKGISNGVARTCSNIYAYTLTSTDTTINANNAGIYSGIWVYGDSKITNSKITSNTNGALLEQNHFDNQGLTKIPEGGYGIVFGGIATINNSTITTNNNTKGGIYFKNSTNENAKSLISKSTVIAKNNGPRKTNTQDIASNSQISLLAGIVNFNSTNLQLDASGTNKPNIGLGFANSSKELSSLKARYIVDGITVGAISSDDREILGVNSNDKTIIISGSVQADSSNMKGDYSKDNKWNTIKLDDEVYVSPINSDGTKLVKFKLNKEINLEVNGDINKIIYYDPNTKTEYIYTFRYNNSDEDIEDKTGNNAYIWTPVSIINYNSTEGFIKYGNSTAGKLINGSSKTDQKNNGIKDKIASDITIFGNNLNVAEKIMPSATKAGYKFAGWYIPEYKNWDLAAKYAKEGNYKELYKLLTIPFTSSTKILSDFNDLTSGVGEITIYAKWIPATVNIYYIDKNTGQQLIDMDILEGLIGTKYKTSAKKISGYTYISDSGNTTGEFQEDLTTVIYYYVKNDFGKGGDGFETNNTIPVANSHAQVEISPPQTGIYEDNNKSIFLQMIIATITTISILIRKFW